MTLQEIFDEIRVIKREMADTDHSSALVIKQVESAKLSGDQDAMRRLEIRLNTLAVTVRLHTRALEYLTSLLSIGQTKH